MIVKKLDTYIIKQFGLLFIATFFICQFVLMMQFLWQHIDKLIGKGLTMDVMAQFFGYMALFLVPQALPLAILLSSIITFGNLGEKMELTAIKSAGISLMQVFRPLIVLCSLIAIGSFYFQNNVGPHANQQLTQLLMSMKQKSPELEIPEGVFYDGIPGTNIYVQQRNLDTGMLYGIMIYRMSNSFEDASIILADSGMLQSTADKKHLTLSLWSGEWFENMRSQELAGAAAVPYRRETFWMKHLVIDFDSDFNLADAGTLANNARGKSLAQISHAIDSLNAVFDSIGRATYNDARTPVFDMPPIDRQKKVQPAQHVLQADFGDSIITAQTDNETQPQQPVAKHVRPKAPKISDPMEYFQSLSDGRKRSILAKVGERVAQEQGNLEFREMLTTDNDKVIRQHQIEAINKFTQALACLIFFFIGAPLGAIIRKGGLGMPIIISVFVFIVYYVLDNTGYRMARGGMWAVWFGKAIAPAILIPLAVFVTYKANRDSAVFNVDRYKTLLRKALGLRTSRPSYIKEVIIDDPDYQKDADMLTGIVAQTEAYASTHKLKSLPNPVNVFFRYQPDHEIEDISEQLECVIDDLANSRDKRLVSMLSKYPVIATKAHTRPFPKKWMNIAAAIVVPAGVFFYLRMCRFRLRLDKDLAQIQTQSNNILQRINAQHLGKEPVND